MESKILYIFTRTPLHVGAGASVGAIDQPIIRERHTGFPIIPGSGIKGVLRDRVARDSKFAPGVNSIFGDGSNAGCISFSEAKILAFPVRSAKGGFAFVTCPLVLKRFKREYVNHSSPDIPPEPDDMQCLAGSSVTISRKDENGVVVHTGVVLEEYRFNRVEGSAGEFSSDWESLLLNLLDDPVWNAGKGRFVLLGNGDFSHFVRNACEVSQHVGIDPKTGVAKERALFNVESVPAETLFFGSVSSTDRSSVELDKLAELCERKPVLQFGGDGSTGLGFCTVKLS